MLFDPFGLKPNDLIEFSNLDEVDQFVNTLVESCAPIYFGMEREPLSGISDFIRNHSTRCGFPLSLYLEDDYVKGSYLMMPPGDLEFASECLYTFGHAIRGRYLFRDLPEVLPIQSDDDIPAIDLNEFLG